MQNSITKQPLNEDYINEDYSKPKSEDKLNKKNRSFYYIKDYYRGYFFPIKMLDISH